MPATGSRGGGTNLQMPFALYIIYTCMCMYMYMHMHMHMCMDMYM